jgi:hypothetical protein
VYVGMVMDATCNCVPEGERDGETGLSTSLNCQRYQSSTQGSINATVLNRGECSFDIHDFGDTSECPQLEAALLTSGK